MYAVVNNSANLRRRSKGAKSQFDNDCGARTSGRCILYYYLKTSDDDYRYIVYHNGNYCSEKVVCSKRCVTPLTPQPSSSEVYEIHRYYANQMVANKPVYRKRVSWMSGDTNKPVAVIEYVGQCIDARPHGNSKGNSEPYVCTPATTMESISEQAQTMESKAVYHSIITSLNIADAPCNTRVIVNKLYNDKHKGTTDGSGYRLTFADEIQALCSLQQSGD